MQAQLDEFKFEVIKQGNGGSDNSNGNQHEEDEEEPVDLGKDSMYPHMSLNNKFSSTEVEGLEGLIKLDIKEDYFQ